MLTNSIAVETPGITSSPSCYSSRADDHSHPSTQTTVARLSPAQLLFFQFPLDPNLFRDYIQLNAPETLEFIFDGYAYTCPILHIGIQLQLCLPRFVLKFRLDRSQVLAEMLGHSVEGFITCHFGLFFTRSRGDGIVLPIEVGGNYTIKWQRPHDLQRLCSWARNQKRTYDLTGDGRVISSDYGNSPAIPQL